MIINLTEWAFMEDGGGRDKRSIEEAVEEV